MDVPTASTQTPQLKDLKVSPFAAYIGVSGTSTNSTQGFKLIIPDLSQPFTAQSGHSGLNLKSDPASVSLLPIILLLVTVSYTLVFTFTLLLRPKCHESDRMQGVTPSSNKLSHCDMNNIHTSTN
jgi:hypothetical protein